MLLSSGLQILPFFHSQEWVDGHGYKKYVTSMGAPYGENIIKRYREVMQHIIHLLILVVSVYFEVKWHTYNLIK